MCRSQAEGGQRCAAHAKARMDQAARRAAQARASGDASARSQALDAWEEAAVEYASTPTGHDDISARLAAAEADGNPRGAARWASVLRRGESLREANQAAATAVRGRETPDVQINPPGGPWAAIDAAREAVARDLPGRQDSPRVQINPPGGPWAVIDAARDAERREQPSEPSDAGSAEPAGGGAAGKQYRLTGETEDRLRNTHPQVSASWALQKGLWEGRRVAVGFLKERGDRRHRTDMRVVYGTLVLAPNAPGRTDQIGVRGPDGEVHVIHASRARHIWDLTREKNS